MSTSKQEAELTPEAFNARLTKMEGQSTWFQNIVVALLIVLFIGFAGCFVAVGGIMIDAFNNKQVTYQILIDRIDENGKKVDELLNKPTTTISPAPPRQ